MSTPVRSRDAPRKLAVVVELARFAVMSWKTARHVRIAAWIRSNVWLPRARGESAFLIACSVVFDTIDGKLMDGAGNPVWRLKMPPTTSQNRPRRLLKTTGISSGDSVRVVASRMWLLLRLRSIRWIWTRGNICRT